MQPRDPAAADSASADPPAGLSLLVTLPALDEEKTIGEVIGKIPRAIPGVARVDVLVVDDGSSDRTRQRAEEAGAQVLSHASNRGVGAAFHTALTQGLERGADLIVTIDSDGQFDPADIPALIAPVVAGDADFTTASRFIDPALLPDMPGVKLWGNRMMSRLVSNLAGQKFYDVSCGMRCYHRRAAQQLYLLARFTYTQEVFLNLAFRGLRIAEVPIRVRGERQHGTSRVAGNLWNYGFRTAFIIFRSYRDYHPLRFFGVLALLCLAACAGFGLFFLSHYLTSGKFFPYTWVGVTAGAFFGLAVIMLHFGVIGDMLNRHRIYLEELLHYQRQRPPGP
ncbi:MAG: glycosyltransferase family 2 protein [Acidobacteriota bacterium]